jgi:hypothetical protein
MRATGHGRPGRAVFTSFVATADDAGLPDDPEFRSALRDHMRWAVDEVLVYSPKTPRFLRARPCRTGRWTACRRRGPADGNGLRTSRPVSRILFPGTSRCPVRRPSISACRRRQARATYPQARTGRPRTPAQPRPGTEPLGLAPGGVYRATPVTRGAGGLLHHRFTLTARSATRTGREAVCSLWHCPAGRPGLPLTTTLPCGVRTFLGGGDEPRRRGRPADSSAPATVPTRSGSTSAT